MEKLMIWIIWLIALLIVSYSFSPKNALTPQFAFLTGFLIQAVYAISYVDLWNLDFHPLTLKVLFIGSAVFVIASCCFNYILSRTKFKVRSGNISQYRKIIFDSNDICYKINISNGKLIFFALLQILIIFCIYTYLIRLVGGSFSKSLYYYRIASINDIDIGFPYVLELLQVFSATSGYIFSYIFLHGLIYKYPNNKFLLVLNYILSIFCSLTSGARSEITTIIIVTIVQAYFIYGRSNNWRKMIPLKMLLCGIVIFILFFNSFKLLGSFMGRNAEDEYYMAVYLSAELKNFDTFIRNGQFGSSIADCYTLSYVVKYLGIILGIPSWVHTFYNPFRTFRGMNLGNVSTIFYANMHDGGIGTVIFFMVLMAFISQIAFINCQKPYHNRQIDMNMIIYPYIFRTILFSFFSNHFYEMVFNSLFIKTIFFCYITRYFLLIPKISLNRKYKKQLSGISNFKNDRRITNG